MLWEHCVLNRIYKTNDFKGSTLKNNNSKISVINDLIKKYNLNQLNLKVSQGGALYILNPDKSTFYFDYLTNCNFILYTNFFEIEKSFVNYDQFNYEGVYYSNELQASSQINSLEGEAYSNGIKLFLLKLLLMKDYSATIFKYQLEKIEKYLSYRTYLIGNNVSHYDVILLSIIQNITELSSKELRIKFFEDNNYLNINRWSLHLDDILELDYSKLAKVRENKSKEYYTEGVKLISNQELVSAIENDKKLQVIQFLEQGENVNSCELKSYKTLTHLACRHGNLEMVKILINYGSNLEAQDDENMTPIYDAVYSKNLELCDFLIEEKKVSLNHLEIQDRTPFYWAACSGDLKVVDYLLTKKELDINKTSKMGRTALSKASWNGHVEIVRRICQEKNVEINIPDNNGRYPLHNAVWGEYGGRMGKKVSGLSNRDSPDVAEILIQAGHLLEVEDNEGFTPLMIAASTNGLDSLKLLISKGANPNHLNKYKATAIIEATRYGNPDPVKVLLDHAQGVDLDIKDNFCMNAIDYAVIFKSLKSLQIMIEYKDKNGSLTSQEVMDYLLLAVTSDSKKCFEYLVQIIQEKNILFPKYDKCDMSNDKGNYEKDIIFLKNIIDRVLNLSNFFMFNTLYSEFFSFIELFFIKDVQFLIKALILKNKLGPGINVNELDRNFEELSLKDEEIELKGQIFNPNKQTNNSKNLIKEAEKEFSNCDDTNFTNFNCELKNLDNSIEFEENNFNQFKENISYLYSKYLQNIIQHSPYSKISHNLIKLQIFLNDEENLINLVNTIQKYSLDLLEESITVEINNYDLNNISKRRKIKENIFKEKWEDIFNQLNYHNCITISLISKSEIIIQKILCLNFSKNYIFSTLNDNRNVLHFIFQSKSINKFKILVSYIEKHCPSMIHNLIDMLHHSDHYFLTPLDVLMKNKLYDYVETYTNILNELRIKYNIKTNHQSDVFYKIINYEIVEVENINLPERYMKELDLNLRFYSDLLKKMNSHSKKELENVPCMSQLKKLQDCETTTLKLRNIVNNIKKNSIKEDFKICHGDMYKYTWVDNEESLSLCCEHLKSCKFIGVDLEFYGSICEKDGIVCLLQLSSIEKTFAIDSLKLRSEITKYLREIFESHDIIKIFHGCDNDLDWLITNFGIFTNNIFDTGRSFLVLQKYILNKNSKTTVLPSLSYLTRFFMGLEIDKSYQKSDWRIRPLTQNMLQYALNDAKCVIYLFLIFIGYFLFLETSEPNLITFKDEFSSFYEDLKNKFYDNDTKIISKLPNPAFIYVEITYRCLELIKLKIRNSYSKLNIKQI